MNLSISKKKLLRESERGGDQEKEARALGTRRRRRQDDQVATGNPQREWGGKAVFKTNQGRQNTERKQEGGPVLQTARRGV